MSLFTDPAEHAANPPQSWRVSRVAVGTRYRWNLSTATGILLDSYPTKTRADEAKQSGFLADLYAREARWYAGEPVAQWKPYAQVKAENDRRAAQLRAAGVTPPA